MSPNPQPAGIRAHPTVREAVFSLLRGFGMNTGIQDAHNLAAKLALVPRKP